MAARKQEKRSPLRVGVTNFKSVAGTQWLTLKPLTLISGVNSAGKSTLVQPLLLIKQTIESQFDPGPLLLDGPNISVDSASEFASLVPGADRSGFAFEFEQDGNSARLEFSNQGRLELKGVSGALEGKEFAFSSSTDSATLSRWLGTIPKLAGFAAGSDDARLLLTRNRCFFRLAFEVTTAVHTHDLVELFLSPAPVIPPLHNDVQAACRRLIHLPGLRGTPRRDYPRAASSATYPGTFEPYAASVLLGWQEQSRKEEIDELAELLGLLDLTWKAEAVALGDTKVVLKVGRLPKPRRNGLKDLVSIADVGIGVSQAFPVVVALVAAQPGDTVYIEQPEIHLHPRAQGKLAEALARTAKRGVTLIIETHSSILLRAVQSLIAEEKLDPEDVAMHWCDRDPATGATTVRVAELQADGSYGDWPSDFDEVDLESESRYLDAVERRLGTVK